jgi:hypothetical protein
VLQSWGSGAPDPDQFSEIEMPMADLFADDPVVVGGWPLSQLLIHIELAQHRAPQSELDDPGKLST